MLLRTPKYTSESVTINPINLDNSGSGWSDPIYQFCVYVILHLKKPKGQNMYCY